MNRPGDRGVGRRDDEMIGRLRRASRKRASCSSHVARGRGVQLFSSAGLCVHRWRRGRFGDRCCFCNFDRFAHSACGCWRNSGWPRRDACRSIGLLTERTYSGSRLHASRRVYCRRWLRRWCRSFRCRSCCGQSLELRSRSAGIRWTRGINAGFQVWRRVVSWRQPVGRRGEARGCGFGVALRREGGALIQNAKDQ